MHAFPWGHVLKTFTPDPPVGSGPAAAPPSLESIDPDNTTTDTEEPFTLTGADLLGHGAATVTFHRAGPVDFVATGVVVVDDTTITGTTLGMSNGTYDVVLTFADLTTATLPAAFNVSSP